MQTNSPKTCNPVQQEYVQQSPKLSSHDRTAVFSQRPKDPGQVLLDSLLQLVATLLLSMLLLLSVMLLLLTTRVSLLSLVLVSLLVTTMVLLITSVGRLRLRWLSTLEVDEDPPLILLISVIPQSQLLTQLFNLGLDLLHTARRVVALANDSVQVHDASLLIRANPLLENSLCLLDELSV